MANNGALTAIDHEARTAYNRPFLATAKPTTPSERARVRDWHREAGERVVSLGWTLPDEAKTNARWKPTWTDMDRLADSIASIEGLVLA